MWRGLYNFLTDRSVRGDVPAGRFFVSRALRTLRLSSLLTIPRSGYKLRFYPTAMSALLWSDPEFGLHDEAVFHHLLRPGDVFIDVGANVGAFTLAASAIVGPKGRVFAVEAHPKIVRYLRGNIALNRAENVTVIPAAAGEKNGKAYLTSQRSDDLNFISQSGIQVPVLALDSVIPLLPIRLMKVDVEGAELAVLKGAREILARTEFVYFESSEKFAQRFGYSSSEVIAFLRERGFKLDLAAEHVSHEIENILAARG